MPIPRQLRQIISKRIRGIAGPKGALVFDVDWTLLSTHKEEEKRETLDTSSLRHLLVSVFRGLSHVCAISANAFKEQTRRLSDPLRSLLQKERAAHEMAKLVIFVDGAALKHTFGPDAQPQEDRAYNRRTELAAKAIPVATALGGYLVWDFWNRYQSDETLRKRYSKRTKRTKRGRFDPRPPRVLCGNHHIRCCDLPGRAFDKNPAAGLDEQVRGARELNTWFKLFPETKNCEARPGGEVTVDVVKKRVDKKRALTNLIKTLQLHHQYVIYIGDEFAHGNDRCVVGVPRVIKLSVDRRSCRGKLPRGVIWIGERMNGTKEILKLLKDLLYANSREGSRRIPLLAARKKPSS